MSTPHRITLSAWLVTAVVEVVIAVVLLWLVPAAVAAGPRQYSVPLTPRPTVVRGFDAPEHRWQAGHRGVDLAATTGAPVLAAGAGLVRFAGEVADRPVVSIQHPDGVITTYEPVTPTVSPGDHVGRGDPIGTVLAGHPECPVAVCLHWGARLGAGRTARYLDPLGLIGAVRVRLKPVQPDS